MPGPAPKGFWYYVEKSAGCWLYQGGLTEDGYGVYRHERRSVRAHRHAYELLVGPIPPGRQLDHLCRGRNCVNPAHLEPVTPRENTMRGLTITAANAAKRACANDHPFTSENTYIRPDGARGCRECRREATRRWNARQKEPA